MCRNLSLLDRRVILCWEKCLVAELMLNTRDILSRDW